MSNEPNSDARDERAAELELEAYLKARDEEEAYLKAREKLEAELKVEEERAKEYAKTHSIGSPESDRLLSVLAGGAALAAIAVYAVFWLLWKLPFN